VPADPQTFRLGRSDVFVSRLGLGTAPLGGLYAAIGETEVVATLARAVTLGIGYFDTAPLYGYGLAEERLGAFLRGSPMRPVISTKVGRLLRTDVAPDPSLSHDGVPFYHGTPPVTPIFDFSADGIRRSLEESLVRLGVDRVDIAFIHDPDDHLDLVRDESASALLSLKEEGLVGAIGVGTNQWEALVELSELDGFDCFLLAGRYSLLDHSALDVLLPRCLDRGISVIVGGVFSSGVLADPDRNAHFNYVPADADVLQRARAIHAVAARYEVPVPAIAIQFPLAHPAVVSVLFGARTPGEVEAAVAGLGHDVPAELWEELRALGVIPRAAPVPSA
jgi:D-threo-aldose 1-dehydrogenase